MLPQPPEAANMRCQNIHGVLETAAGMMRCRPGARNLLLG
jgi:hypothetical protein